MSVMRFVEQASRAYTLYRDAKLKALGLTAAKATYLASIRRHPGSTQEELATRLVYNASSVARQVESLEKDGFVFRQRCEDDKRQFRLYITKKGEEVLPEVFRINTSFIEKMNSAFTVEELETLSSLCDRLRHCAKEYIKEL